MSRIMALDYGKRRTGIAVTDPFQIIATSLTTVETKDLFKFLKTYFEREETETLVIGLPLFLSGGEMDFANDVHLLCEKLTAQFPTKKIVKWDERFTSKMASQTILAAGKNKKARQDKSLVDRVSATILLQNYLESIQ